MSDPNATFTIDTLSVRIYKSEAELAGDAAQLIQTYLQEVLDRQGFAAILLATGASQIKFLNVLIERGGVDWSKITLFHLDEYLGIDENHPASFRRYLRERVEHRVHPACFHYIEGDAAEPVKECDRYAKLLQAQPIDLCCLGLGENGHLAFNDPPVANFQDPLYVKLVKLDIATRQQQVKQGFFSQLEAVPQYAFTVTMPAIGLAKKIICLAPEKRKALAVKSLLEDPIAPKVPASYLRSQPQATLFLDTDSASLLSF